MMIHFDPQWPVARVCSMHPVMFGWCWLSNAVAVFHGICVASIPSCSFNESWATRTTFCIDIPQCFDAVGWMTWMMAYVVKHLPGPLKWSAVNRFFGKHYLCQKTPCSIFSYTRIGSCGATINEPGTSAGGSMLPCRLRRKFFLRIWLRNGAFWSISEYVVSIAPFSTPACPDCSQNIT